jgi:hypothetical protein
LLTATFDDAPAVREAVQGGDGENLARWLSNRSHIAETTEDPAEAAWALRQVLVALAASPDLDALPLQPSELTAGEWVTHYVTTALSDLAGDLGHHMAVRRRLATASFRLAAFACFGDARAEAFNAEPDPLAEALDRIWLLASKLTATLPGLVGGVEVALYNAEQAVRDFGLNTPTTYALDAFDPFAFGETPTGTEDVGHVMTLAALLRALPEDGLPLWWTPDIERLVVIRAERASAAPEPDGDETVGDRFSVGVRLRTRPLAEHLLERVRNARGV